MRGGGGGGGPVATAEDGPAFELALLAFGLEAIGAAEVVGRR